MDNLAFESINVTTSASPLEVLYNLPVQENTLNRFLNFLGKEGKYQNFVDFTVKKPIINFEVGEVPTIPSDWESVYFSVFPMAKIPLTGRGKSEDRIAVNTLIGDFDSKDFYDSDSKEYSNIPIENNKNKNWKNESENIRLECKKRTLKYIESLELKPSCVVDSGGGYHVYWFLESPYAITNENRSKIETLLAEMVATVKSDKAAKDLARVLRLPTTYNKKYNPNIKCKFYYIDFNILYSIVDIENFINSKKVKNVGDENINSVSVEDIILALGKINPIRKDDRENWLDVGRALHDYFKGDAAGLALWDSWSATSEKYIHGETTLLYSSFNHEYKKDGKEKITYKTLLYYANEDSGFIVLENSPKKAKPSDYMRAIHKLGFTFKMNGMNDRLYADGLGLVSDGLMATIFTKIGESGFHNKSVATDAIIAEAYQNQFHPIKSYLELLQYNGENTIKNLANYIIDADGIFEILLRKFLIGAVEKILNPETVNQNMMLVLEGKQDCGKSVFASWLCSPIPQFFISAEIHPESKDDKITACSKFIWEVAELASTTTKSDRDALKQFITNPIQTFRSPYGRFEIDKPVTCSFIGTVNDEGNGFLNDPTGFRRFRVVSLRNIDWDYMKNIDVNQLWAEAVYLYKNGELSRLESETQEQVNTVNSRFDIADPLEFHIHNYFEFNSYDFRDEFVPSEQITLVLAENHIIKDASDKSVSMRIAGILKKMDMEKIRKNIDGRLLRGYSGMRQKTQPAPF